MSPFGRQYKYSPPHLLSRRCTLDLGVSFQLFLPNPAQPPEGAGRRPPRLAQRPPVWPSLHRVAPTSHTPWVSLPPLPLRILAAQPKPLQPRSRSRLDLTRMTTSYLTNSASWATNDNGSPLPQQLSHYGSCAPPAGLIYQILSSTHPSVCPSDKPASAWWDPCWGHSVAWLGLLKKKNEDIRT